MPGDDNTADEKIYRQDIRKSFNFREGLLYPFTKTGRMSVETLPVRFY